MKIMVYKPPDCDIIEEYLVEEAVYQILMKFIFTWELQYFRF